VQIAVALSHQIGSTLGGWARYCFLLGFWAAVFSSLLGVWQGVPYLFADFMCLRRKKGGEDQPVISLESTRDYKLFLWGIGTLPLVTLWLKFEAVQVTYAVMGAFFMPLLALTLLIMNNRKEWVGAGFRNGIFINILLVFTLLFFGYSGVLKIKQKVFPAPKVEIVVPGK
jgi:hypothetical protein